MIHASPSLSIIVPCRNEKEYIAGCVSSILRQDELPAEWEVIVADGMSDDGTREVLHRLAAEEPRLRIVDNPARIVPTGLNAAIAAASGDVIMRMDAHTAYAPDYVRSCLDVLRSTGADNVGGPWVASGTGIVGQAVAAAFQSRFAAGTGRGHNPEYEGPVDTVYLGCWPRDVFERIGIFDEALVRNQDDEFNLRLATRGGLIWQSPRIRSWYTPRNSVRALLRQYSQYGYWKVRVVQKHGRPASIRHVVPAACLLTAGSLSVASLWSSVAATSLFALSAAYGMCLVAASARTAANHSWKLLPVLPVVFACYHAAYGYGFLRGVVDFLILRRESRRAFMDLTRRSVSPRPGSGNGECVSAIRHRS